MKIKTIFPIILIIAILFGNISVCKASTNNSAIQPYYVNISDKSCRLEITGIKAKCTAYLSSKSSTNLSIKMELQKQKSSGYETVKTWTSSTTGKTLSMSESRNINVLSTYRLKVTFTAGNETVVQYAY